MMLVANKTRYICIWGSPGAGKTYGLSKNILKKMNYDTILKYDAGDVRNKTIIENITKHNMSDTEYY